MEEKDLKKEDAPELKHDGISRFGVFLLICGSLVSPLIIFLGAVICLRRIKNPSSKVIIEDDGTLKRLGPIQNRGEALKIGVVSVKGTAMNLASAHGTEFG
jgi:hypothetical protein